MFRSVLYPEDITNFDELVSLHEIKLLREKEQQEQSERGTQILCSSIFTHFMINTIIMSFLQQPNSTT